MGRFVHAYAIFMALILLALFSGEARAGSVRDSAAEPCVLATDDALPASAVIAASGWNCQPRTSDARHAHPWVRIAPEALPADSPVLVGEALPMDGLLLARKTSSGELHTRAVTSSDIRYHWTSGTRFALPIEDMAGEGPLYVRVDGALGPEVALGLRAVPAEEESSASRASLVLLGVVFGILALTAVISGFMAVALRQHFAAIHFAFSLLLCLYVAASGSLIFLVVPEATLMARSVIAYASIAWAVALLAPFVITFFERDAISPLMRRMAVGTALLALAAGFYLPLGQWFGVNVRPAYNLSFIPGALITVAICVTALRRGSRAAKLFLWAWSVPFLFAVERVFRNLGLYSLPPIADFAFYLALAVQGTALTLAVGWRINGLRRERDAALAVRHSLEREARFDALTGLNNRRDYAARDWQEGDILALIDIDRFKAINDTYGHDTGDRVLVALGRYLAEELRDGRLEGAWRLGGEEFAVVLRDRNIAGAAITIDRIRRRIPYAVDGEVPGLEHSVTASAGVAALGKAGADECYRAADRLLYNAKRGGRDRLCFREDTSTPKPAFESQLSLSRKVE